MTEERRGDTRSRILEVAAQMIAATPGEDVSLRAVCAEVGVKMPTLYHFFGSKQGLLDAVVERGFDLYLAEKEAHESSGDPIQDLRDGWDAHVAFGVGNPGFYSLMYGQVRPGYSPAAQSRPSEILRGITAKAEAQGRLVVSSEQAAAHVLATNIGLTLRMITLAQEDWELSNAVREGVISAITGTSVADPQRSVIHQVLDYVNARPDVLGTEETALLSAWLRRLSSSHKGR
ncbi:TetR/AcrR family transcriptional regulator [Glutamicibacter sp. PS]|uniref:TetR/AcrR family transcriptional regulator n=1 Tax=Glutamicibacter sp. PS TaxID=3075634 RepID=UPI002852B3A8|nr:TetR/AcrR family transcriptional regulator [Glutamicibacter sp. PS]